MITKKKISFIIFLLCWLYGPAQISYNSWVNGYMSVSSYGGNTIPDAYTASFSGNGYLNVPYWRLSVRLKQPVTSTDGNYTLPANKISFSPVSSSGNAFPYAVPTISQIGMPLNVVMQEGQEVFWYLSPMLLFIILLSCFSDIIITFSSNTALVLQVGPTWEIIRHGQPFRYPCSLRLMTGIIT